MTHPLSTPTDKQFAPGQRPLLLCPWHGRPSVTTAELVEVLRWRDGWDCVRLTAGLGVDRVRSQMASLALEFDSEWFFWCDDDNFLPIAWCHRLLATARERDLDMLAAVVPCRRSMIRANCNPLPGTEIVLGKPGPVEVLSAGLAMAVTHRRVFERLRAVLPTVHYYLGFTEQMSDGWPFFLPSIDEETHNHLGEDYSFCKRARESGSRLWVEPGAVAYHESEYTLSLKDLIGAEQQRAAIRAEKEAVWF